MSKISIPSHQRNISIDIAKGICIILMVVGHSSPIVWLNQLIYLFHMPTFFLASGYLFRERNLASPGKYVRRKVKGLWWPFFFWSMIYLLLHNIFAYMHLYSDGYSAMQSIMLIPRYAIMAGTERLLGGFWFLSALLFATISGYCYYKWIGFSNKAIIMGILMMLVGAEVLCYLGINHYTVHLNSRDFMAVAYFLSGTLYARIDHEILGKYKAHIITCAIIFLALQTTFMPASIDSLTVASVLPFYITSTLSGVALILLCQTTKTTPLMTMMAKIGVRTIDVLIFHFLFFKIITAIYILAMGHSVSRLSEFPVLNDTNNWLWIAYTVVAVALSYMMGQSIIKLKEKSTLLAKIIP